MRLLSLRRSSATLIAGLVLTLVGPGCGSPGTASPDGPGGGDQAGAEAGPAREAGPGEDLDATGSDGAADADAVDGGGSPDGPTDLVGGDTAGGDGGAWEGLAPLAGGPRQETAVVELGGLIYVLGGFDERGGVQDAVEVYDPGTDRWDSRQPLPAAVHHANAAAVAGKLYVLGALQEISFTAIGNGWVYDPDLDRWDPVADLPAGTERGSAAVGVIGSTIYLAGGYRGGSVDEVQAYDTAGNQWESLPALPTPRDHLVGAAVDGTFYAIGGRTDGITAHTDRVDAYDPGRRQWSSRAAMPTSRGGSAAGVAGGLILVVGGEGNTAASTGVFAEAEAYDPAADRWMRLPPMRTPRHGTGAAGLDGNLYVPGGADRQAFSAVDTVEVYRLP